MQTIDYRPKDIEFKVNNNSIIPDTLGLFETDDLAIKYIHDNLAAYNQKITVDRYMDNFEKSELRKEYQELLELKIPLLERDLNKANIAFEESKRALTNAKEALNSSINEIKGIANKVKEGITDITLDDLFTFRIPFQGQYYFFTYMDKQLKLATIKDIPMFEKDDLFNSTQKNELFFTKLKEENGTRK